MSGARLFFVAFVWVFLVASAIALWPGLLMLAVLLVVAAGKYPEFRAGAWLASLRRRWLLALGVFTYVFLHAGALKSFFAALQKQPIDAVAALLYGPMIIALMFFVYLKMGKQMPQYLDYLGGGGMDEVRQRMADAPAATGVPFVTPLDLADRLKQRVLGQDAILDTLAAGVLRRTALRRPNKPLLVALLVGATGAGKTETAKALAVACAGEGRSTAPLIRIDCNELSSAEGVQRLIGAPPGYIGSEAGGQLTRAIVRERGGVILLDELEKAHPNVLLTLMGLLDEARLTEQSTGTVADARDFVVLATSNAEHERIAEIAASPIDEAERTRAVKDILRSVWRPEQLARMDFVLAYQPLGIDARAALIVKLLLGFARDAGVQVAPGGIEPAAVVAALQRGNALASYGVRELARALENEVMDALLEAHAAGAAYVRVAFDGASITVEAVEPGKAQRA